MIGITEVLTLASIYKIGSSLGASMDEIKAMLPALAAQAINLDTELAKLQTMPQLSQKLAVDLGIAHNKERHDISGDFIQAVDIDGDVYVQFNQIDSEKYNLNTLRRITTPFDTFFLSNDAQAGKSATLIFGKGKLFEIQDVSPMEINIVASNVVINMNLQASDIMMPIDIQSSFIMMPVDIQAQYLNLKMDIVAQTIGNIDISIAGQIDDVTINLTAQTIAIKSQGEWSSQQSELKTVRVAGYLAIGATFAQPYTVTTGKTLYITDVGGSLYASDSGTDGDKPQICGIDVYDDTAGQILFSSGGNGGLYASLTSPFRLASGHVIYIRMLNNSGHGANYTMYWKGYEI